jgi:basic membrane protein A
MRKGFLLVFSALLAFGLITGCGGDDGADEQGSEDLVSVRLLTDGNGIDDKSFNAAAWRGILEYYGDTWENPSKRGSAYDVITASSPDMYIPNLKQATDEGYDLIIATGYSFADALASVAGENPDQYYMIVDVEIGDFPNVIQATFAEHEGSYLVGVAAALKAIEDNIPNPSFGFIGGIADPTMTKFEVGFVQGVLSVLPGARINDYYVNSWEDPASAKSQAKNWYDSGVYMIYSAAGASGNGTIAQAKEYRSQGKNVWAIGVDSDQYEDGIYEGSDSAVYTSMLKRVEAATRYALEVVEFDIFRGEVISFDLKSEGVGYSITNPAMSDDIKGKLDEAAQKIINGEVFVVGTYEEAKMQNDFPQDLKALD